MTAQHAQTVPVPMQGALWRVPTQDGQWVGDPFETFDCHQDWRSHRYGGVYVFAKLIDIDEWIIHPSGYLAKSYLSDPIEDANGNRRRRTMVKLIPREAEKLGLNADDGKLQWWPLYADCADNIASELVGHALWDKAVEHRGMTHVHILKEPDKVRRAACFKALHEYYRFPLILESEHPGHPDSEDVRYW